jgi:hypothetical protein
VEVSENPVRGDSVIIAWPPPSPSGSGNARISVFSYTGERVSEATVAAPSNEYVWDLTLGGARRVVNGAYIVVVEVGGQRYRRRLFVARRSP